MKYGLSNPLTYSKPCTSSPTKEKINQDSRRKLKQIYHLFNFIKPLLEDILGNKETLSLVNHGAGKSYLGFIIYDLFFIY